VKALRERERERAALILHSILLKKEKMLAFKHTPLKNKLQKIAAL
jgi:hypothetical protein